MVGIDDPGALNDFLHRFLDDRERGAVQEVGAYLALFPGSDTALAAEYAALTGGATEAVPGVAEGLTQIGPYRLLGKLGHGAFGLVYRAEDTRLHRTVALKVLARAGLETEREREQFEREAAIASRLDHPGICTVYEIARHGLWTCIAMRCVPGETLASRLARRATEPLPAATAIVLIEKVARALHAAHSAGVVHRDVKAGNIMVTPEGEPVVVDFGLARDTNSDGSWSAGLDRSGSPSYMAPEQVVAGIGPVDARTDVWALGVTLYECLAGSRPFEAPTQAALFDAILRREPLPLRDRALQVSRDLEVVVAMALCKEPALRYQSAHALADDLLRVQRGEPVLARPIGRLGRLVRWSRRNRAVAALLAAVLLVLSSGLAVASGLWVSAEGNLRDWERLADGRRCAQLQQQANDDLLPPTPDKVQAMRAWLAAAEDVLSRQPGHEQALAALRARARPWTASTERLEQRWDDAAQRELAAATERLAFLRARLAAVEAEGHPAAKVPRLRASLQACIADQERTQRNLGAAIDERLCYEFDDARDQLQHDQITQLVLSLRWLRGAPGPSMTTIESMTQRLHDAETLHRRTIEDHAIAWREAIARVRTNPRYGGFELVPQLGIVPVGADPESHLEEFAAPETGAVPERRNGRLAVGTETALVFVLLPPGRFVMGAQATDPAAPGYDPMALENESPVRTIDVQPFFLSKYEMTQGQWLRTCNQNPSTYNQGERDGDATIDTDHPVETISYRDAEGMLRRLGWWLPIEARWEYAARGGTTTPWWCDEKELLHCGNLADRRHRDWDKRGLAFVDGDDGRTVHAPVGSYRANPFGLHDTIGNVGEWCFEQIRPYDPARTTADAVPYRSGSRNHVIRGGSLETAGPAARSSARSCYEETVRTFTVGVRPMRAVTRE